MGNEVFWVLELSVIDGKAGELSALITEMSQATQDSEPGTLNYEWFLNEDKSKCTIYERYADSEALLIHLGNFGANFAERFMSILTIDSFKVFGPASDQVMEALSAFGATYMGYAGGFNR